MRFFCAGIYKNMVWVYLCILCCFAYHTMLGAIPDHVYMEEGQILKLDQKLPVKLTVGSREQTVMADAGETTYQMLRSGEKVEKGKKLTRGEHSVTCYFLGVVPVKTVNVSVVKEKNVYSSGHVVGIYGATQGVLVLGTNPVETADGTYQEPAEHVVFEGDYITAVNGKKIEKKEELIAAIQREGDTAMILTLLRGNETIDVSVRPADTRNGYMLGIWVKDDMAGIGTLTYYEEEGQFGALGHGIGDGQTGELLRISSGELYRADILSIKKGKRGNPGELEGVVHYGKEDRMGKIDSNTDIGIYGTLNTKYKNKLQKEDILYPVCYKQDVKIGSALIISDASGETSCYHITIDSLDFTPTDRNKGICFHVDDKNLLELTGGIVQGLSGSPIIQDGKVVGAVTHVFVNDPTKGYGIFIENMLK